jgi:hypothetical protein
MKRRGSKQLQIITKTRNRLFHTAYIGVLIKDYLEFESICNSSATN